MLEKIEILNVVALGKSLVVEEKESGIFLKTTKSSRIWSEYFLVENSYRIVNSI